MNNSKLLQIIKTFSDKELKEFEKFMLAQTQDTSNMFKLFEIIKKDSPLFESETLSKKAVFLALFGNSKYSDVKVREQMSLLRKIVDQFLIQIEKSHIEFYNQLFLLKQFRKRKLINLFEQQVNQIEANLKNDNHKNAELHLREFLFADEKNNFFEQKQIREHDESISFKNENLDKYYFSTKLKVLCELKNRANILNSSYETKLSAETLTIIANYKNDLLDTPSIHCYFEIFNLLNNENDEKQFLVTFNMINQYQKAFKDAELKSMYAYLLNYCIQHVNKGIAAFTLKLFELQKLLLTNKILLENGMLSHISYRNIVSIAIKLKEYNWAEKFIEDYNDLIENHHRKNAYNLSKSNLLYARKEYSETVFLLNQVNFTDVYYAITSKYTLTKAYYALKEFETLDYFISSFLLYLKRNKDISANNKKSSENFLKHFKKLLLIVKQTDFKESEKIEKKIKDLTNNIKDEKIIANRDWLLEEIGKISI